MSLGRALIFWAVLISAVVQRHCQPEPRPAGDEGGGGGAAAAWNRSGEAGVGAAAREERLRSALYDAFQTIKSKGGVGEALNSDLIGSASRGHRENSSAATAAATDDSFDRFFADDDGLSFADAGFAPDPDTAAPPPADVSHNVQHIVKASRRPEEPRPVQASPAPAPGASRETIIARISDSIRSAVNETRQQLAAAPAAGTAGAAAAPTGIEGLLRIFDAEILLAQWGALQEAAGASCRRDLDVYVGALAEHRLWALKMDDASGRYTSAFYWGNNYWTGSAHLCSSLADSAAASAAAVPHATPAAPAANRSKDTEIFADWRDDTAMTDAGPPFSPAFYMLKLQLSSPVRTLIHNRRTVHLGLCLPRTCSLQDVERLVAAARHPGVVAAVLGVRSEAHNPYHLAADPTFRVLLGVTLLVCALLTAGTWYDVHLSSSVRRARRRAANMSAGTPGDAAAPAPAADHKLDLNALDNVTMTNGKSVYSVNNNIAPASPAHSEERLTVEPAQGDLQLSVWSELLLSFSAKANILQIFDQSVGADTIPVVHGLRSLSMVWVILGHACIVAFKYADNTEVRKIVEKEFTFQIVVSAVYSVDTFFCLGGLLVSFLYFRTDAKGSLERLTKGRRNFTAGVFQFFGLIGYRFARLTAPYLFMLGVVEVTMKWFHYNSVFEPPTADHETCPKYWWRNILYINTLFPVDQMCMLWSWYLSDDSQFYALSAILLILATSHFKLAAGATGFFFVSSLLTTGYVSWSNEHIPNAEDPFTSFDKIYDKPWTRLGPYLVGLVTGWILFKTNLRIKMSKVWVCVGWTASMSTLLFLVFGLYSVELDVVTAAVYASLSHTLWAAGIAWIIIACSTGYGGWLHKMLSAPVLYPFSRVTYCAYLVHPVVIRFVAMQLDHPLHLGKVITIVMFLGMAVVSYVLSFAVSVAFEAPVVTMLKILSPHKKPHRI